MTALLTDPAVTLIAKDAALQVVGDVDVTLAADLATSGTKWINATELTTIVLDFSQVNKASSVAISVLFEWLRACQKRGINVHTILLSSPLERLTSLAELDQLVACPASVLTPSSHPSQQHLS